MKPGLKPGETQVLGNNISPGLIRAKTDIWNTKLALITSLRPCFRGLIYETHLNFGLDT